MPVLGIMPRPNSLLITVSILLMFVLTASSASADKLDPERVKAQAVPALEDIIKGISEGDYELYARDFSQAMRSAQTRESFLELQKNVQKNLGKFQSMEYLGFLNQNNNTIALFKARFSKEKDDVEIRLVLEQRGSNPRVTGLWLDAPALNK